MLQRWAFPSVVALGLAVVVLGPVLGPGALLNLDLVAVDHWPTPQSMWGIGPELPRSVPAELALSAAAWATSGATAVKIWFVCCVAGSFLTMFRLLRGLGMTSLAWYAGGLAYALNPFLLTRLAVGHTTLAGVYALAPLVLPIILRGTERRPQVVLASAALAFMGFFGGLAWGAATLFALVSGRGRGAAVQVAAFAMHLPWLVPSLFLLADGPSLVVDDVFRPGGGVEELLSLAVGYGFWQPTLEAGLGIGSLSAVVGLITLVLVVLGARQLTARFGTAMAVSVIAVGVLIAVVNRSGPAIDWIFDIPGASVIREPQRFLVLVFWWTVPASLLGAQRLLDLLAEWSESAPNRLGLLIPPALIVLLISPALWGLHEHVEPVDVPADWSAARDLTQAEPGTILVLPWDRYLNVSFASNRRVLNPALRYFGPDIIHGGQLGLATENTDPGVEAVDARLATLRSLVAEIPNGATEGQDLADHGVRWILLIHEVDYRGFLTLADSPGVSHQIASEHLDLFAVQSQTTGSGLSTGSTTGRFPGRVAAGDEDRALATASPTAWLGTNDTTETGLPVLPAGNSAWNLRAFVTLATWWIAAFVLLGSLRTLFSSKFDKH